MSTPNIVTIPTENPNVTLRQLATEADDTAYFEAVDANRDHLSQFGDETAAKYQTVEDVRESRMHAGNKLRLGIWDQDTFVGFIRLVPQGSRAEIGYWLDGRHTGHGYATIATRALAGYGLERFPRLHADVIKGNEASAQVLTRAGFAQQESEADRWIFSMERKTEPGVPAVELVELAPPDEEIEEIVDFLQAAYANTYPNGTTLTRDMFEGNDDFRQEATKHIQERLYSPDVLFWRARKDGEVVGTIGLKTDPAEPHTGEVVSFYVADGQQGEGIGNTLFGALSESAAVQGLDTLTLNVAAESEDAIRYYERKGFAATGDKDWDWPHWVDDVPVTNFLIMQKKLR